MLPLPPPLQAPAAPPEPFDAPPRPGNTVWRRLRKDRLALGGALLVLAFIVMAIAAPHLAPHGPNERFLNGISDQGAPLPPGSAGFLLGTDTNGRDVLSRLLWGARVSLLIGLTANGVAVLIGVTLGAVAGYYGGPVSALIMRFTDVMLAFPVLLLGVALVAILTPGVPVIIGVIGLVSWTSMARIIHGQVVSLRERDFVEAARAVGVDGSRILVRHILPHLISPIVVYSSLGVATAVLFEASLSYLGIGIQPPDPSWGKMVAEGAANQGPGGFAYPWLLLFPGAAVFCTVLSFNLLGDGLRDALDPQSR